jgi:poly-gamma-glutamate capsule biosynthesis protein CapA/YwtB (metallophosphatase superfamily)
MRRPGIAVLAAASLALTVGCTGDPEPTPEPPRSGGSTSSSPTLVDPSSSPEPEPPTITLTIVGDIMLVRGVPDPAAALAPLSGRLASADITVGNLESTLSLNGEPQQPNDDSFGGTPALLEPLARAGFDALSLGNNHTGDYETAALVETVRAFDDSPIVSFGAGEGLREASRPAIIAVGGVRFAFVAFNAIGETPQAVPGQPGALSVRMPPRTGPLNRGDIDHVADVVRQAKRRADVVVVVPHWGGNYTRTVDPAQRAVARRLVAAGADLVVGGHPHWVQGSEEIRGVPVFYSLGNFIFDMDFMAETMEGVLLETTWRGDRLVKVDPVAYRLDPVSFAPRVVRGAAATGILDDLRTRVGAP